MKQPKKLTRSMKIRLSKHGYDPGEWRYKPTADSKTFILVHKVTGERKVFSAWASGFMASSAPASYQKQRSGSIAEGERYSGARPAARWRSGTISIISGLR